MRRSDSADGAGTTLELPLHGTTEKQVEYGDDLLDHGTLSLIADGNRQSVREAGQTPALAVDLSRLEQADFNSRATTQPNLNGVMDPRNRASGRPWGSRRTSGPVAVQRSRR